MTQHRHNEERLLSNHSLINEIQRSNADTIENSACGWRHLWRAVIAQALVDAVNGSKKISNRIERRRAIAWFSPHNEDFLLVCSHADLDPGYVLEKARRLIQKKSALTTL